MSMQIPNAGEIQMYQRFMYNTLEHLRSSYAEGLACYVGKSTPGRDICTRLNRAFDDIQHRANEAFSRVIYLKTPASPQLPIYICGIIQQLLEAWIPRDIKIFLDEKPVPDDFFTEKLKTSFKTTMGGVQDSDIQDIKCQLNAPGIMDSNSADFVQFALDVYVHVNQCEYPTKIVGTYSHRPHKRDPSASLCDLMCNIFCEAQRVAASSDLDTTSAIKTAEVIKVMAHYLQIGDKALKMSLRLAAAFYACGRETFSYIVPLVCILEACQASCQYKWGPFSTGVAQNRIIAFGFGKYSLQQIVSGCQKIRELADYDEIVSDPMYQCTEDEDCTSATMGWNYAMNAQTLPAEQVKAWLEDGLSDTFKFTLPVLFFLWKREQNCAMAKARAQKSGDAEDDEIQEGADSVNFWKSIRFGEFTRTLQLK